MNNDDMPPPIPPDDDYEFIPNFAPGVRPPSWAYGDQVQADEFGNLREIYVPDVTKEILIGQLWLEAMNKRSNNQGARVKAIGMIAELKGWIKTPDKDEVPKEDTSHITLAEAQAVKEAFNAEY